MIERIEPHEGTPPPGWDNVICRLDGTIFHSAAWSEYQRAGSGVQPWFLSGIDSSGSAVAAAVAYLRSSRRPILSKIFRSLQVPAHPIGTDQDGGDVGAMMKAIERLALSKDCAMIQLDSFMSARSGFMPGRQGYRESGRVEFVVDLTRDLGEVWRAIGKDQRERIRKLERQGLDVVTGDRRVDLDALRLVQWEAHERRVRRGQQYALTEDEAFYDRLHRYLIAPGIGRLFLARKDGEVLAALFFSVFSRRAFSMFSGSNEVGYRLGAQSLLFWHAAQRFRADGVIELNRGGVPAESAGEGNPLHGIYQFKRRLGGSPVVCRSGLRVLRRTRYELICWSERIRRARATRSGGPE